jgi:hypothetical protein
VLQETPSDSSGEPAQKTTNYRSHLGDFSNENWGMIVMGAFALFLLIMIRRSFKR